MHVNRSKIKTSDNKNHNFSITKLEKEKEKGIAMPEPIETLIIRAQQNFDVEGGLNPIQIEIKDDRITNILKKYKNVVYKKTPLGILLPASVKNDTTQIFILRKNLSFIGNKKINIKPKNI